MQLTIRNNSVEVSGYVNAVERLSKVLVDETGDFIEIVKTGTFARALERADSVGLMFNHRHVIGSTKENLQLEEDPIGLHARAVINDPDVVRQAKAGKLTGWSFGFYINGEDWGNTEDGMRLRTLTDIDLVEVSILDVEPAYIATSVEVRSVDNAKLQQRDNAAELSVKDCDREQLATLRRRLVYLNLK